jgi:hypothetical protein
MTKRHPELVELDKQYSVVRIRGKTRVIWFSQDRGRQIINFATFHDFKEFLSNKKITVNNKVRLLATTWLSDPDRPTYDGVTFEPGNKERVINGKLNLWRGWGVEPKRGSWRLMQQHILEVIAGSKQRHYDYIIKWIAKMFQEPATAGQVAICLISVAEGAGKGTLGNALIKIVGQHGVQISSTKHLTGNFNAHLQDCIFLFSDEALWPGDRTAEGTLNRIITEQFLQIEPKGIDSYSTPNYVHLLLASNKDWVIPASIKARRFAVFEVSEERVGDLEYFKALHHEMDNGGLSAMLYDLLRMDLSDFNVQKFPRTRALVKQKVLSLTPFQQWWVDLLERGHLPNSVPGKPGCAYTQSLLVDAHQWGVKYLSGRSLGTELHKLGCQRMKKGTRGWQFPSLKEAREKWEIDTGIPGNWTDEELEGDEWGD